jgi:hypothetical protein
LWGCFQTEDNYDTILKWLDQFLVDPVVIDAGFSRNDYGSILLMSELTPESD